MIKKFLFLDFECANIFNGVGKICSVGYVLTDRNFNVISAKDILCNPESPFLTNKMGNYLYLQLAYSVETFNKAPSFDKGMYFELLELIDDETLVIGFGFENDLHFLLGTLNRYKLNFKDFKYFDVQKFATEYLNTFNKHNVPSLNTIYKLYDDENLNLRSHKSVDDSYKTMLVLKKMINEKTITYEDVVNDYNSGSFYKFVESQINQRKKEDEYFKYVLNNHKEELLNFLLKYIATRNCEDYLKKHHITITSKPRYNFYKISLNDVFSNLGKYLKIIVLASYENYIYDCNKETNVEFNYLLTHVIKKPFKSIEKYELTGEKLPTEIKELQKIDKQTYLLSRYVMESVQNIHLQNYFMKLKKNIYEKFKLKGEKNDKTRN